MAESSSDKYAYENRIVERFGGQTELELVVPTPSVIPPAQTEGRLKDHRGHRQRWLPVWWRWRLPLRLGRLLGLWMRGLLRIVGILPLLLGHGPLRRANKQLRP
jgi:hypothetical protein